MWLLFGINAAPILNLTKRPYIPEFAAATANADTLCAETTNSL